MRFVLVAALVLLAPAQDRVNAHPIVARDPDKIERAAGGNSHGLRELGRHIGRKRIGDRRVKRRPARKQITEAGIAFGQGLFLRFLYRRHDLSRSVSRTVRRGGRNWHQRDGYKANQT